MPVIKLAVKRIESMSEAQGMNRMGSELGLTDNFPDRLDIMALEFLFDCIPNNLVFFSRRGWATQFGCTEPSVCPSSAFLLLRGET